MSHVPENTVHDLYDIITSITDQIKDVCARLDIWSSIWPNTAGNRFVAKTKIAELKALAKCMKEITDDMIDAMRMNYVCANIHTLVLYVH